VIQCHPLLTEKTAGHEIVLNHENKEVAVSYDTFLHEGVNWAIIVEKESEEIFSSTSNLMKTLILITTVLLFIIVILGVYVSNVITAPILESINSLAEICNNLKNDSTDLNTTASTLKETADSQNRALESTVQSMEQMTATITQNSSNAESSNQMSNSSLKTVQFGKVVVNELNQAMKEISQSNSELLEQIDHSNTKISEIVSLINEIEAKTKIINDIVFQTKLLSFNASVESARAGEHGKGFSVVAEEIGNLATVSGDSAKEISEMLSQSNEKVQKIIHETKARVSEISNLSDTKIKSGQEVASKCAQVFEEINQNVDQVSRLMNEITHASKEQSQGIGSINTAMSNLSSGTSQSAEMANKSFQASELLKHRSQKLDELLYVFESVIHGRK